MDSMPAISFSLPSLSSLKPSTPEDDDSGKTQHLENTGIISSIVNATSDFHLPRGISETDTEKEKKWYIGSIDCGTTSSRFLIFDGSGNPTASHQIEFENIYPESGWHEHDPIELFNSVEQCINEAVKDFVDQGHTKDQIKTIGITTQRETTICWDSETGEPLYNAVVWPDTRTSTIVRELKAKEGADKLQDICGLPISTYPSGVKLLWMLRNVESVKNAYEEGRLSFGTVDTWLIYKLNGGREANVHVTDTTNASRTMFMNLKTREYDDTVLDFFEFDRNKITLPKIVPSADKEAYGKLASTELKGWSITGCLGDQSAALVGQCGFSPGEAKSTYGTGCFVLYNVGTEPVFSTHGLLATVAYDFGNGRKPVYALEGSVAVAGSGVKFLMNNMGFIAHSSKITELAQSVKDNGGVVFVTAFSGLFAPYWIDDAKGTLFGITAHTQRGHIARATLEATCYQTKAILDAMEKDSKHKLGALAVDGGMSNSDLTMQTQADILGIKVDRPVMRETTALGAAIAAGFAINIWKEFDELKEINKEDRTIFEPQIDEKTRNKMFKKWEQAVQMCRGWVLEDETNEQEVAEEKKEVQVEKEQVQETEKDTQNLKEEVKEEKEKVVDEKESLQAQKGSEQQDAAIVAEKPSKSSQAEEKPAPEADLVESQEEAADTAKVLLQKEEEQVKSSTSDVSTAGEAEVEPTAQREDLPTPLEQTNPLERDINGADEAPVKPAEELKTEEWPVVGEVSKETEGDKIEESKTEESKTEESKATESKIEESKIEEPKIPESSEESKAVTNPVEEKQQTPAEAESNKSSEDVKVEIAPSKAEDKSANAKDAHQEESPSKPVEHEVKLFSEAAKLDSDPTKSETSQLNSVPSQVPEAVAPVLKSEEFPPLGQEVKAETVQV